MRVAQQLYEGIDTGEGAIGLITYMRTDSVTLAEDALAELRGLIAQRYGEDNLPDKARRYKTKSKNAQEAHEAIRPTSAKRLPDALRTHLTSDQYRLYDLVWKRTVACQMIHATMDTVAVDLAAGEQHAFRANGSVVRHPGFMTVYREDRDDVKGDPDADRDLRQRAYYYIHINADPVDPNTVYVLNVGMHRSVDGGESFEEIEVPHGDVHDLWINPNDAEQMVVANDGGGQVSVDQGASWSTYYNQPTAEFYSVEVDNQFPYRVYAPQQDNSTISVPSWREGGTTPKEAWMAVGGCETGPIAFDPDNPTLFYSGCYGGTIELRETGPDGSVFALEIPRPTAEAAAEANADIVLGERKDVLAIAYSLIVLLTEITSNTATTAAFLPILGAVAVGFGENPFLLTIPAALGASCAFMLPVATPPNAIVYGSGLLSIPQMSRVGIWLNLLFIVVITAFAYGLLGVAFGVELGTLPDWAVGGP